MEKLNVFQAVEGVKGHVLEIIPENTAQKTSIMAMSDLGVCVSFNSLTLPCM